MSAKCPLFINYSTNKDGECKREERCEPRLVIPVHCQMAGVPCLPRYVVGMSRRRASGRQPKEVDRLGKDTVAAKAPSAPKAEKKPRQRAGPSDTDILQAMGVYEAEGTVITSTVLRDHFGTKTRQVIRQAMKGLAKAGKIRIEELGGEGKKKHFVYKLP